LLLAVTAASGAKRVGISAAMAKQVIVADILNVFHSAGLPATFVDVIYPVLNA
jgi:hypothetical protein|tara:strand:- start:168 stop:326 length:159 start_codon:yes stop_codon:yes gene_type:complete